MRLPIAIPLKRSRHLVMAQIAVYGIAAGALLAVGLSWPLTLLALLLIGLSLLAFLRRSAEEITLHLGCKGELEVETKVGVRRTAGILPETLVLPGLILLALDLDGVRRTLTLPGDAMEKSAHRQLRVWLRWQAAATARNPGSH